MAVTITPTTDVGRVDGSGNPLPPRVRLDLNANRTNLLTNPSCETATTGWIVGSNCAISQGTPAVPLVGTKSLRTTVAANGTFSFSWTTGGTSGIPVTAGKTYTFSQAVRAASSNYATFATSIAWYTAGGGLISQSAPGTAVFANPGWVRYSVTATAPGTAAFAAPIVGSTSSATAGDPFDFDAGLFEEAASSLGYFDGTSTYAAWTGTAHASTSVYQPPTAAVRRLDPDGQKRDVRQGAPATLSAGLATVYDYEAPFDLAATYYVEDVSGTWSVASAPTTLTANGGVWLIHPGLPENSEQVSVVEWPTWTRPITRGLFQPLGRRLPIVTSQLRSGETGTLTLYTDSPTRRADLIRLLDYGVPLMLKGSPLYEDAGSRWVAVGDVEEQPIEDGIGATVTGFTLWTLPLVVVDPPSGVSAAAWSYANANAYYSSYADATTKAATYTARSAGF